MTNHSYWVKDVPINENTRIQSRRKDSLRSYAELCNFPVHIKNGTGGVLKICELAEPEDMDVRNAEI